MATRSDSPLVTALLSEAEAVFGHPVRTPSDFVLLAGQIEDRLREHISESTIKRLWKPSLAYKTVSGRTLNTISQYAGYQHFQAFCDHLANQGIMESEIITGKESIKASDLIPGDMVQIAWMPNRECTLRYIGSRQFVVLTAINSKIQPGDTFYCSVFIKGRPLYVDSLVHDGVIYESYGIGTEHGLTRLHLERTK